MQIKKITAAVLSAAMLLGFAGCNKAGGDAKSVEQIEDLIGSYGEALNEFSADDVLDLTNWKKKDSSYKEVAELLDIDEYKYGLGSEIADIYEYISSTIVIDYESDNISVDGDKASVKVTYELVDWKEVYKNAHPDLDSFFSDLKSSSKTISVKGKLSFELEDKEWKISKITNLDQVYEYIQGSPRIDLHVTDPAFTDPEPTETEPSETDFADVYDRALGCYIDVLKEFEDGIRTAHDVFGYHNAGFADLDNDRIPELYFLATTDDMKISGDLYVFSYNEEEDAALQIMYFHNVVYMAADGGGFMFYLTSDKLVLTQCGGEESLYHYDTKVYDLGWYNDIEWHLECEFRREEIYDYDTDEYSEKYYKDGIEIEYPDYSSIINGLVGDAKKVLLSDIYSDTDAIEFQQKDYENVQLYSYDMIMNYLEVNKKD